MIGEIYTCAIQGTHCGAPFSVSLAYKQIAALDEGGLKLVTSFWREDGPGGQWMGFASNKLKAQCMSWSSPTDIGAALLEDRVGIISTPALPPVVAALFHLRPLTPWYGASPSKPKYDVGRFYLPGLVVADSFEFQLTGNILITLLEFGNQCLELPWDSNPAFRLVPFPEFVEPPGGEVTVRSCVPDSLLRRIKTRRPNTCELFAGAAQSGGRPVIGLP